MKQNFRYSAESKDRVQQLLLEKNVIEILFNIDGERSVTEIADRSGMPIEEVIYHLEYLKNTGLICHENATYAPRQIVDINKNDTKYFRRRSDDLR